MESLFSARREIFMGHLFRGVEGVGQYVFFLSFYFFIVFMFQNFNHPFHL